jgi:hypothetical protein
MIISHYINENKSDIRAVKPGWYAIDDCGKLYSGPFSTSEECQRHTGDAKPRLPGRPTRKCSTKEEVS